ncbi:MAG TPA: hypothetical protein PK668_26360 [Myxococcota bacterium]|nr:hypothetical protein [Myxococcota bacterium]HRY97051.1 hypothetical protein [Myxococcota bacterium]HSA22425.1 hypothetical protein [Myxococcota bacterium]
MPRVPRGDLFPFVFPALAYANLALREPGARAELLARIEPLLELAQQAVAARLKPPGGRLEALRSYRDEATYLGSLNLALGAYRLAGGGARFEPLHAHLSALLLRAARHAGGRPLRSCPGVTWPYDSVPVLLSLRLRDRLTGRADAAGAIRAHLTWLEQAGLDPAHGLPWSRLPGGAPRGCDLSLRLDLLAHLAPELSARLYRRYTELFWLDWGLLAGFAEHPGGQAGATDLDSGPIALGIGLSATGLGFGAALAHGDEVRLARLASELAQWPALRDRLAGADIPLAPGAGPVLSLESRYLTGFLYGDVMLFYALSWTPWPD